MVVSALDVHDRSIMLSCAAGLSQLAPTFQQYKINHHRYPAFRNDGSLSDKENWKDIFFDTDPNGGYFTSDTTSDPRLPRMLEKYLDSIDPMICPGQGSSGYWKDLGPYYANIKASTGSINEMLYFDAENNPYAPLAGCQNPEYKHAGGGRSWRHGEKDGETGLNNHLFIDGSVRVLTNPLTWNSR